MSTGKDYVDDILQKYRVVMFSKSSSPDATKAQVVFDHYNFKKGDYFFIDMDNRDDCEEMEKYVHEISGHDTVPFIFIDGQFYGNADDLIVGEKLDTFDERLNGASIHFDKKPMH
uniref:Glutaredoxin domain-containing protein n=1 Tax=Panagrolaimus sp. ES5 TaxID=591445 RepID=A0AC34FC72_9BILA